ncbi:polysaccharide deacetylase [Nocardioides aquiterrae]|uniref:Polysaccharide deacetylase n=1 Tax=Nocardioides aquiterrae TaxID=203799 RepID=A0ABN1UMK0_9ACTN
MPLQLPEGKRFAAALTFDLDAQCLWMGMLGIDSPSYHSRGEFGALVGAFRVLDLLAEFDIKATWCVPGHSLVTFPDTIEKILEAGHEIAAHGCYHEAIPTLEPAEERRLMDVQLAQHQQIVGRLPRGYRSPAWDYSAVTAQILEDYGFDWDSSLMGRDFEPYRARPVDVRYEEASTFGAPSPLVELPVSWYLDDAPDVDYIRETAPGLGSHRDMGLRWQEILDYGRAHHPGGLFNLTMHPQTIGRAHHMLVLESLIQHAVSAGDVWFTTLSDACDAWIAHEETLAR